MEPFVNTRGRFSCVVSYTYDNLNRLSSVTSNDESVTYTYDDNSNLLQTVKADGSIESYTYNNANQLTQKIREINGITLESYLYTYYLNGNIRTHNETLPDTVNHTYTYDGMGRLINETVSGDYIRNDTYTYDRRGNRTGLVSLDGTTSYVYNKSNQLLSKTKTTSSGTQSNVYSYDNFGNRVQNILSENDEIFDTVTYQYDAFNRLDRIYSSTGYNQTYTYDGDNLRQTITDNNSATIEEIYDNGNIIGRKQGGNTYGYVYGLEHEWYFSDSESGIYSTNYRGDVSKEIQPNGTEKIRAYSAYGDSIMSSYAGVSPFGYAGEVTDTSGLIYLRNRYYDPETGTFLTLDPIKDGFNWYSYCENNPVMYVDPNGTDAIFLTNEKAVNSGDYTGGTLGKNLYLGHTAVIVQNENEEWYYFSWGKDYADFIKVDDWALNSLDNFNNWLGIYKDDYTTSTYIGGDFSESVSYFQGLASTYVNDKNEKLARGSKNNEYDVLFNNCLQVVYEGLNKGILSDGKTKFESYVNTKGARIPNVEKT